MYALISYVLQCLWFPEDGDVLPKRVGVFVFTDNVILHNSYAYICVYINDYKHKARNE